ncbi:MAG TPA: O-methyltransferase [Firmicutes bacterium]|nr:O-methyltransferase [Bacillota bacterium]
MEHNLYYTEGLLSFLRSYTKLPVEGIEALLDQSEEGVNPSVRPETAALLFFLVSLSQPVRILEIGTCRGTSSIIMAKACPEAEIITIEIRTDLADAARGNFCDFGVERQITLMEGDMKEIIPALDLSFDFIFLDGAKKSYPFLFPYLLKRLHPGGIWVTDDVFLETACFPEHIKGVNEALQRFNAMVIEEESLIPALIPLGHGLLVAAKKKTEKQSS